MLLTGLGIAGVVYILVSIVAVALVPIGELEASDTPLVEVVKAGAPGLPIEKILPVHHDVRGVQHGADQHADGQQADLRHGPAARAAAGARAVHPRDRTPWVAIMFTTTHRLRPAHLRHGIRQRQGDLVLGGTTSLLLLAVFAVVNVAVLVLRRDVQADGRTLQDPDHSAGHRLYHLAVPGDAAVRAGRCSSTSSRAFSSSSGSCCSSSRWRSTAGSASRTPASRTRRGWAKRPTDITSGRAARGSSGLRSAPGRVAPRDAKDVRGVRRWAVAPHVCVEQA